MNRRTARLNELIKAELSEVIRREMKDPRVAELTSILGVEISPDLRVAKVYVSVLGTPDEQEDTIRALRSGQGFLRNKLGDRLTLKRIPTLDIHLDRSIERGNRLLQLMSELETPADDPAAGDRGS